MEKLSLVVPMFNEEECVVPFYKELKKYINKLKDIEYEIIFINDGSKDNTLEIIKKLCKNDNNIKYISFSRNFGKESAMYAGLKSSTGDYVAIMDADLQDPPSLLPEMLKSLQEEDYDSVATKRLTRKGEPVVRSFLAHLFYKLINKISKVDIVDGARDYRLMKRKMVDAIVEMAEYNRFSKGIFGWVGFNTKWLAYDNVERVAGKSKWSFGKLFLYSLDGITAFSTFPLTIASILGMLFIFISFIVIILIIIKTMIFGDPTSGWPSLACIIFFGSGVQLFCIGVIGQYLSKMYLEVKNRPIYIVKETNIK